MSGDGEFVIDQFGPADIDQFLSFAAEEEWVSHRWELEFLMSRFPRGCLVVRGAKGTVGFVTSVCYGRSAWVGNLLVSSEARRRGLGRSLMERVVHDLDSARIATIWLTASTAGKDLYESLSFRAVDSVERWVGRASGGGMWPVATPPLEDLVRKDALGWGGRRDVLLGATLSRGEAVADDDGFLIVQPFGAALQLGPWTSSTRVSAAALLDRASLGGERGATVFLDAPVGNHMAAQILSNRGFSPVSSTLLMCRGLSPRYRPELVYALASMGSMG